MEEATKAEAFKHTSIFRPGLLERGGEKRAVEKLAGKAWVHVCGNGWSLEARQGWGLEGLWDCVLI